jgi:hypothetical protein
MEALRRSVGGGAEPAKASKPSKKPRKPSGQKEMLMPIEGKKPKETPAKKPASSRSGSRPSNSARPAGSNFIQRGFA